MRSKLLDGYDSSSGGSAASSPLLGPLGWDDPVAAARGAGRRAPLSKAERWEGVDSGDDERPVLGGRTGRQGAVSFVSGGSTAPSQPEPAAEGEPRPKYSISFAPAAEGGTAEEAAEAAPAAGPRGHPGAGRAATKFGFLRTSGKADVILRMMKNAGWREGAAMGAREQGIAEAIEVRPRPVRAGIGSVEEKTSQQLRWERGEGVGEEGSIFAAMQGDDPAEQPDTAGRELRYATLRKTQKRRGAWRRGAQREPRDGAPKEHAGAAPIVDLRGREPRVLGSIAEAAQQPSPEPRAEAGELQALRSGLRRQMGEAEQAVRGADAQLEAERARLAELERGLAGEERLREGRDEGVAAVETMVRVLGRLRDGVARSAETTTVNPVSLGRAFEEQFRAPGAPFAAPYKMLRPELDAAMGSLAAPLFDRLYAGWDPPAEPGRGARELQLWRALLLGPAPCGAAPGSGARAAYSALAWGAAGARLRAHAAARWHPHSPDFAAVVAQWAPLLGSESVSVLLDGVVLPKLRAAVERWDPRSDPPLGLWVLPWAETCAAADGGAEARSRLEEQGVLSLVSAALSQQLGPLGRGPAGEALVLCRALLRDWQGVLPHKQMAALVERHPGRYLRPCLAAQSLEPPLQSRGWGALEAVGDWADPHLLLGRCAEAVASELLPKLADVLAHWLLRTGDCAGGAEWVAGMRRCLPAPLAEHPAVGAGLARLGALQLAALQWRLGPGAGAAARAVSADDLAAMEAAAAERNASAQRHGCGAAPRPAPGAVAAALRREGRAPAPELSLREHLEQIAAERSLSFLPRQGLRVGGKQVWAIGGAAPGRRGAQLVYFDRRCLFIQRAGGEWEPASISEAVESAAQRRD